MGKGIIVFLFLVMGLVGANNLMAQPPDPGGGTNDTEDPPCWPPPCVPIDGGLSFLLAAGLAYGGKKAYDISKEEK